MLKPQFVNPSNFTTEAVSTRKPRGQPIETALQKALESDPAGAMEAMAEEAIQSWRDNAPREFKGILDATTDDGTTN